MTLAQEAYALIQKQPEDSIRLIIELLKKMDIKSGTIEETVLEKPFKRTGAAKGLVSLPEGIQK